MRKTQARSQSLQVSLHLRRFFLTKQKMCRLCSKTGDRILYGEENPPSFCWNRLIWEIYSKKLQIYFQLALIQTHLGTGRSTVSLG